MNQPKGYENISIDDWTPLSPGGHKCVLKEVQEVLSSTGKAMLKISFDTDQSDTQPRYFSNQYLSDKKAGRTGDKLKWRGVGYLITDENTEYGPANLKRFNTAVEDSNPGFKTVWGDGYGSAFKNKNVGIVFREEEYTKEDHTLGVSVKPFRYCNFEKVFEQKIPERKVQDNPREDLRDTYAKWQETMPEPNASGQWNSPMVQAAQEGYQTQSQPSQYQQAQWNQAAQEGFMKIPEDALSDEGLPFH